MTVPPTVRCACGEVAVLENKNPFNGVASYECPNGHRYHRDRDGEIERLE